MSSPAAKSPTYPFAQQAELNAAIEVDTDQTAEYENALATDTTSVASAVFDFKYDNGRRYTRWGGNSKYMQPNDETEQDRLDMNHQYVTWTLDLGHVLMADISSYQNIVLGGELFTAPLESPRHVLDLGTGTGIWALDFGDCYPAAEVTGVGAYKKYVVFRVASDILRSFSNPAELGSPERQIRA